MRHPPEHTSRGWLPRILRATVVGAAFLVLLVTGAQLADSMLIRDADGNPAGDHEPQPEGLLDLSPEAELLEQPSSLVTSEIESIGTDTMPADGDTLNENTCAVIQCHPMLNDVPITSRHGKIKCVTCHSQRRAHTEQCVSCHELIRGHTESSSMDGLREQMQELRASDPMMSSQEPAEPLPPPIDCLICHLKMKARPLTFPQIVPTDHIPADQSKKNCVDCHRAHDPKPLMGHPMPMPYCRRGRDCCLSCHLKIPELTTQDRVTRPVTNPSGVLNPPVPLRESGWAEDTFMDWVLNPPLVASDHGHGTVECISCHGIPPTFHDLAKRVHNFELESVRCGKCHTGSTIIDQQVLLSESEGAPEAELPHH